MVDTPPQRDRSAHEQEPAFAHDEAQRRVRRIHLDAHVFEGNARDSRASRLRQRRAGRRSSSARARIGRIGGEYAGQRVDPGARSSSRRRSRAVARRRSTATLRTARRSSRESHGARRVVDVAIVQRQRAQAASRSRRSARRPAPRRPGVPLARRRSARRLARAPANASASLRSKTRPIGTIARPGTSPDSRACNAMRAAPVLSGASVGSSGVFPSGKISTHSAARQCVVHRAKRLHVARRIAGRALGAPGFVARAPQRHDAEPAQQQLRRSGSRRSSPWR